MKTDIQITESFRALMQSFNLSGEPRLYEYLDGELWYMGNPIENSMTDQERKCLEAAIA